MKGPRHIVFLQFWSKFGASPQAGWHSCFFLFSVNPLRGIPIFPVSGNWVCFDLTVSAKTMCFVRGSI